VLDPWVSSGVGARRRACTAAYGWLPVDLDTGSAIGCS
jgi:hypothetical protein